MRGRAWALASVAGLIAVALGGCYAYWIHATTSEAGAPVIDGFRQISPSEIEIAFDRGVTRASFIALADVPSALKPGDLPVGQALSVRGDTVIIALDEARHRGEYSIVVRAFDGKCAVVPDMIAHLGLSPACDEPGYVEIVRQPGSWLADTFGFSRPEGYSILGRRTLRIEADSSSAFSAIGLAGTAYIDLALASDVQLPAALADHDELQQSARLLNLIWSRALRGGPTSMPYDSFMREAFDRKLDLLANGETAAMCQTVRDLFLHATTGVPGLKARAVEALNYWPQFDDLVPYGHSTAEVWVEELRKWVIVDPWMGFALVDEGGRLLSASDLLPIHRPHMMYPIALVPQVRRYSQTSSGKRVDNVLVPGEADLDGYAYTPVGHAPGYLTYFETIIYRGYAID